MSWVAAAIGGSAALGAGMQAAGIGGRSRQTGGPLEGIVRTKTIDNLYTKLARAGGTRFAETAPFQPITPTRLTAEGFYPGQTPLGPSGLYAGQEAGFAEAVRQAVGRLSGNFANRGFNTPRAIGAIAGSAAQNVLPQFAPLMGQQIGAENALLGQQIPEFDRFRHALSLAPVEVERVRNQQFLDYINALIASLGGTGTQYESPVRTGFNIGFSPGAQDTTKTKPTPTARDYFKGSGGF